MLIPRVTEKIQPSHCSVFFCRVLNLRVKTKTWSFFSTLLKCSSLLTSASTSCCIALAGRTSVELSAHSSADSYVDVSKAPKLPVSLPLNLRINSHNLIQQSRRRNKMSTKQSPGLKIDSTDTKISPERTGYDRKNRQI